MASWSTTMVCLSLCSATAGAEIHVAPEGDDAWSGRLPAPNAARTDGPVASLAGAVAMARHLPAGEPRRVVLQAGRYHVPSTVVLGPADSGLTIEAATGAQVELVGGRALGGWQVEGDTWWAPVPDLGGQAWDFRSLVVNGSARRRARLPREDAFPHLSEFNVPWMSTTGGGWQRKPTPEELTHLQYRPEDLPADLDLRNAELTVYHMWDESLVGLVANDPVNHVLTFANPAGHPPGAFKVARYVVWNVREGLTDPGQWYLDRTRRRVVYRPLPGESVDKIDALAPTTECVLRIAGSQEQPTRDVVVRGLTVMVTNTPLVAGGFGAGRYDGAVAVGPAVDCRLENLVVRDTGGQGIKSREATRLVVSGCEVTRTGACGIIASGTENQVSGCRVHHVGVAYPSAIALWAGGRRHRIAGNVVHHTPYTGIASSGEETVIEQNVIHDVMEQLHDGAGIYITFCKRMVVRGNVVRDIVDTGGYGASAYYLDEQAEDCVVEHNVSVRVARPSHNHMASRNTLRGNIFVGEGDLTLTFQKSADYRLEGNVISTTGQVVFKQPAAVTVYEGNVIEAAGVTGEPGD